ncbi:LITAF domain-containing protein [Caenorhabditis elegans]|uniref:LITAF domain-containing protein n=1 Tax=Caenorhabditis elegans TaxID=6239 RepID=O17524_CAEEL|nr:LITAF domain-containing protein [Caenorhabditis elegans]CCD69833.1 LITAF domain-containing protein [Caenorhabditis elegans]|eukprot:NP_505141.1 Uncharacterized protein CELE_W02D7.3 [Caenorhabditis elegans]
MSQESSTTNDSPGPPAQPQSVRSTSKAPLPKYTSIDLENEIPEMYNTSLNPGIHDPDMTMFFNRNAPPFHTNYAKRHSPPPSYSSRSKQSSVSSSATPTKSAVSRRNYLAGCFLCVFFAAPIIFLVIFYMIPRIVVIDRTARF